MKKIFAFILSIILVSSMATTAYAAELNSQVAKSEAVITSKVPDTHIIKIVTDGNGKVCFDGKAVNAINAKRLSSPTILICPESGYTIDKVMLGDEDITSQINAGYYTFQSVYQDSTLNVTFKAAKNGSFNYSVVGTVTKNNVPANDVLLELRSELKTFTTGKDGKFGFKKVEEGHHTLTAIENGKVVGYTEFYLTRTKNVGNVKIEKNEDGSFNVEVNESFSILELNFNINDSGKIDITDGKATNNSKDVKDYPNSPNTGSSAIAFWLAVMFITGGAITAFGVKKKRKNNTLFD